MSQELIDRVLDVLRQWRSAEREEDDLELDYARNERDEILKDLDL